MKRSVLTGILFVAGSVAVLGAAPQAAWAQAVQDNPASRNAPPIEFEPKAVDLGVGKPGERLTNTVTLRNTGTTPLRVMRLKGSCSCTVPSISNEVIPPGETATMTVAMDPGWIPSKVRKQVSVFVDGFPRPAVVPVLAEVSFAVRLDRPSVDVPSTDPIATVKLEAIDGASFRVLRVNGKEVDDRGNRVASEDAASVHEIAYAFGEDPETIPTYLVIETDHPDGPVTAVRLEHPVITRRENSNRLAGLKSDRHFVNVEQVYPGETIEVIVPVSGLAERDLPTVAVEDERIEVRYMGKAPNEEKRSWFDVKVFVTIKDRDASGMINTPLTIAVPDSNQTVRTYLLGSVRPGAAGASTAEGEPSGNE